MKDPDVVAPSTTAIPAFTPIPGERHVSEVAGAAPPVSRNVGVSVIVAGAIIACGAILLTDKKPNLQPPPVPGVAARQVVRYEPPPLPVAPVLAPVPARQAPPAPAPATTAPGAPEIAPTVRASRLLVYTAQSSPGMAGQGSARAAPSLPGTQWLAPGIAGAAGRAETLAGSGDGAGKTGEQGPADDLQTRLTPTRLASVSATVLRHQPYLLTMGSLVPCILQTAMDSTLPGLVTCVIPQDVLSKTGVTLLDRGTRIVGEFRGGVRQGVERLFVLWTRAETPQGIVINLDSPATDALGRSGVDGIVDRHFWQRFGGALLLTTVDGAIQAGVASASKAGTTSINTGPSQGIVDEVLRGSINIPPTIRKSQGELVSIVVARDLDFSTVYRVQPTVPGIEPDAPRELP